jgi:hypothetical protein
VLWGVGVGVIDGEGVPSVDEDVALGVGVEVGRLVGAAVVVIGVEGG